MTHDACCSAAEHSNRSHAKFAGRVSAVLCISVLSYGYWTAWTNDHNHREELAQMSQLQLAEQAILENLQFGRVVTNDKGIILSANAAFRKWSRWEDCIGEPVYKFMPEPARSLHCTAFQRALDNAKWSAAPVKPKLIECKLPRADDPTKVTHVTIAISVIKPEAEEVRPYVVAYLFKTKSLQRVTVK